MKRWSLALAVVALVVAFVLLNWRTVNETLVLREIVEEHSDAVIVKYVWRYGAHAGKEQGDWWRIVPGGLARHEVFENGDAVPESVATVFDRTGAVIAQWPVGGGEPIVSPPWRPHPRVPDLDSIRQR